MRKTQFHTVLLFTFCFFGFSLSGNAQCDNVTSGGTIEANEIGCPDPIFDPALITNVTLPMGGVGDIEYLWIFTTGDPTAPVTSWLPIPNSNTPDYDPDPITVTTHFMRCARRAGCDDYEGESNYVTKMVACCQNVTDGGTIGESQAHCGDTFDPDELTNTAAPSGGVGLIEYQWYQSTTNVPFDINGMDWSPISGATNDNYQPGTLTETTYFIRLAKRDSCMDFEGFSNIIEVALYDKIQIDSFQTTDLNCFQSGDGAIEIFATGGLRPLTYNWNPANPDSRTIDGLSAGTYELTISDANGCEADGIYILSEPDEFTINVGSIINDNCDANAGATAFVEVTAGGMGIFSYEWDDPNGTTTDSLKNIGAGTYTVSVTDGTLCQQTATISIQMDSPITLEILTADPTCVGDETGFASVNATGGSGNYTYLWNDSNGTTTQMLNNIGGGTYEVTVTDDSGCEASIGVMINDGTPFDVSLNIANGICGVPLGTATATPQGGMGTLRYQWDDANQQTRNPAIDLPSGNINVTVTDASGCTATASGVVTNQPDLSIVIEKRDFDCQSGIEGTAYVTATGGDGNYTYQWNDPSMTQTDTVRNLMGGTYLVTVTDGTGCQKTATVQIGNTSMLSVMVSKTDNTCIGASNGTAQAEAMGGVMPYAFIWSDGSVGDNIQNLNAGTYEVTVTDAAGCQATASFQIQDASSLVATITKDDNACAGESNGRAWAEVFGGAAPIAYSWSNMSTNDTISNLPKGTYSVTATDSDGCTVSASIDIDDLSDLSASINGTDLRCFNLNEGVASVSASGGVGNLTYNWSNNRTDSLIRNLSAGDYTVTVTDELGCQTATSITLTQPNQLTCDAFVNREITTYNGANGEVSVNATGGTQPYVFSWSNNVFSQVNSNIGAGNYFVGVTDQNGCECISNTRLVNPSKIQGFVWDDRNQDGIQDPNEDGLENITVELTGTDINGQAVNLTTTTTPFGVYEFDGLVEGDYQIQFVLPSGKFVSPQNAGNDDDFDSDGDTTGLVSNIDLPQGFLDKYDFGLYEVVINTTIEIGDFVWYDVDQDGVQDGLESGVPGVKVHLRSSANGAVVRTTATNVRGFYLFSNVAPGDYNVEFVLTSLPAGYEFTIQDNTNDTKDSDPNPTTGLTTGFSVTSGQQDDLNWDAGIHLVCDDLDSGGLIGYDEVVCGSPADPSEMEDLVTPAGGYGTIEYLWLFSFTNVYTGPGDPNWIPVPNSNSASYDPDRITTTTYFIRCARRAGCTDYLVESNIIKKEVQPLPDAEITSLPTLICVDDLTDVTARSMGGSATYQWNFGIDANPAIGNGRIVNDVSWTSAGRKRVILSVTVNSCIGRDTGFVRVRNCITPLGIIKDFSVENVQNTFVRLNWDAEMTNENNVFQVQRSKDGVTFETLKSMRSIDAKTANGSYQFVDLEIEKERYFYRIKLMNEEGKYIYSDQQSIEIQSVTLSRNVLIFPNPATDEVHFQNKTFSDQQFEVQILDINSTVIRAFTLEKRALQKINTTDLQSGIYFVKLINQKGSVETKTLIVQKP